MGILLSCLVPTGIIVRASTRGRERTGTAVSKAAGRLSTPSRTPSHTQEEYIIINTLGNIIKSTAGHRPPFVHVILLFSFIDHYASFLPVSDCRLQYLESRFPGFSVTFSNVLEL
ncbi:unnamed protein product [Chrysodeixis includens]|uniref:Uncharacterized protein n=1 Tax=Chrysodeixis includens TaxID=689277 RepID=A0A9N8KV28_CHRIL|nr:unnamed protein product [Chrysodeixis includens]